MDLAEISSSCIQFFFFLLFHSSLVSFLLSFFTIFFFISFLSFSFFSQSLFKFTFFLFPTFSFFFLSFLCFFFLFPFLIYSSIFSSLRFVYFFLSLHCFIPPPLILIFIIFSSFLLSVPVIFYPCSSFFPLFFLLFILFFLCSRFFLSFFFFFVLSFLFFLPFRSPSLFFFSHSFLINYCNFSFVYINYNRLFDLVDRVFANGPGDRVSVPGRVIPKIKKMVLDISLLNTHHYKVCMQR